MNTISTLLLAVLCVQSVVSAVVYRDLGATISSPYGFNTTAEFEVGECYYISIIVETSSVNYSVIAGDELQERQSTECSGDVREKYTVTEDAPDPKKCFKLPLSGATLYTDESCTVEITQPGIWLCSASDIVDGCVPWIHEDQPGYVKTHLECEGNKYIINNYADAKCETKNSTAFEYERGECVYSGFEIEGTLKVYIKFNVSDNSTCNNDDSPSHDGVSLFSISLLAVVFVLLI